MSLRARPPTYFCVIAAIGLLLAPSITFADVYELGIPFGGNGNAPPAGPGPWLRATVSDAPGLGMYLMMESLLTSPTEYVDGGAGWLFNFDPTLNLGLLSISYDSGPYPNLAVVSTGVDAFMADGDGMFDISFDFPQGPPANRFNDGDSVTYLLTYPGVDLYSGCSGTFSGSGQCIDFRSNMGGGQGTYVTAAHVQGTGAGGQDSHWIGDDIKPEPATLGLLLAGWLLVPVSRRRR